MKDLEYSETPVQELQHPLFEKTGVRLLIKREDLNHPFVSGNKWWKLKYNLAEAKHNGYKKILTFGGAFSNHIYSTAAAAHDVGLKSVGIIRGEETLPLNATLSFATKMGMELFYVSRSEYRCKTDPEFIKRLTDDLGRFFLIPEGGTNLFGIKGTEEFSRKFSDFPFDYVMLPVGTGGTISGIVSGLKGEKKIIGVPVFKQGDFLNEEVRKYVYEYTGKNFDNWSLLTNYHHGGYAKTSPELLAFINAMKSLHNLPLDQVYSGKLFYALFEELKKGVFPRGSTLLAIHTGGLQGLSLN